MHLGIDGADGGWLIAKHDSGSYSIDYLSSFSEVWERYATGTGETPEDILVDIPIGLRNDGEPRRCDTEARKRVRSSTVYPTPSRPALYESTYEEAKRTNERVTGGTSLSIQTWNIMALIREVDETLDRHKEARGLVREAHPEVCFWALNGGEAVRTKKQTQEGYRERVGILEEVHTEAKEATTEAVKSYSGTGIDRDDIVDAVCLAVTARGELDTLPEDPPTDGRGIPMEMVFRSDP